MSNTTLTQDILDAFGVTEAPMPITGGRSLCLLAGEIVLKPSDNDEESQWNAELLSKLQGHQSPNPSYHVSKPIPVVGKAGSYVYRGWTAFYFLAGQEGPLNRFDEILQISRAFHTDLKELGITRPSFASHRSNRWDEADLVTWDKKDINDVALVNHNMLAQLAIPLHDLDNLKRPLPDDLGEQLIHGDLTGNILFDENNALPPGIIDMTFYWHPAAYAEAIVVADALQWHGAGRELVEGYGTDGVRMQLLVRALYWRCVTFAIDTDEGWVSENLERADFEGAVGIVRDVMSAL